MNIGTAEAERIDTGNTGLVGLRPGNKLRRHFYGQIIPGDKRTRRLKMQIRRNGFMLKRQNHFHQSGNSRRRLQMSDIGFYRTDNQRIFFGMPIAQDISDRFDFNRITEGCAGPVRFYVVNVRRRYSCIFHGAKNHFLLGNTVRSCQSVAFSVLIDCTSSYDSKNTVAVFRSIRKPLQHDNAAAFSPRIAVCRSIKGFASSIRRNCLKFGKADMRCRGNI